jgi:hypothetical protein
MVEFDVKLDRFRDKETGQMVSGKMFKNAGHAAATVRKDAMASFKTSVSVTRRVRGKNGKKVRRKLYRPSKPGKAPGLASGRLQRSIAYEANQPGMSFAIGPRASTADQVGRAHEFGGMYKGGLYPERSFMRRAMERNQHRFAGQFAGRIGG